MSPSLIPCGCCKDDVEEHYIAVDDQLGPVCQGCIPLIAKAVETMAEQGITRPMRRGDINKSNFMRFNHQK